MTTIGDVLAVVAILVGLGITSWALMISCSLLFPNRVDRARIAVEAKVWPNVGLGLVLLMPGIFGSTLLAMPNPLGKLVGWLLLLGVLSVGAVGAAGVGQVAAGSLKRMWPGLADYPAFVKGSAFLVTASMLPILGWFAFAPAFLLVALGSGARAVFLPVAPPRIAAEPIR